MSLIIGIMLALATGMFFIGRLAGLNKRPAIENIDYKDRWLNAIEILGGEGRLTEEQVKSISLPIIEKSKKVKNPYLDMFSSDRKELEIERAKVGLPPEDDLQDMFSSDKAAVLKARAKFAIRQTQI